MNLTGNPSNPTSSSDSIKIQTNQLVAIKKKKAIIKIQVNRLLKPFNNSPMYKIKESKLVERKDRPKIQNPVQNQPTIHEVQLKKAKKVVKSFQQMYFQKLKQIRLRQNELLGYQPRDSLTNINKKLHNSCKNAFQVNNNIKVVRCQPHSTKNSRVQANKQNSFNQDNSNQLIRKNVFPKKAGSNKDKQQMIPQNKSIQKLKREDSQLKQQKSKKILLVKKPGSRSSQIEIVQKSSQSSLPTSIIKPNSHNNSIQLSATKPANKIIAPLQSYFTSLIQTSINHTKHQHIWGGVQCFLSFDQFQLVIGKVLFSGKNKEINEDNYYAEKLWTNLGGKVFGGVAKKNIISFLNLILYAGSQGYEQDILQQQQIKFWPISTQNYVDKSSLKLGNLTKQQKQQIRKFYFPLRVNLLASYLHHNSLRQQQVQRVVDSCLSRCANQHLREQQVRQKNHQGYLKGQEIDPISQQERMNQIAYKQFLQNNIYLKTKSVRKIKAQIEVSPTLEPFMHSNGQTALNNSLTSDFSPKLSSQQQQPFRSTCLQNELQSFSQTQFQYTYDSDTPEYNSHLLDTNNYHSKNRYNQNRKPLLSVDVNLGEGHVQKIIVYQGQSPYQVSFQLKDKYNVDEELREKFQIMLKGHLKTLLWKIQQVQQEFNEDQSRELDNCRGNKGTHAKQQRYRTVHNQQP